MKQVRGKNWMLPSFKRPFWALPVIPEDPSLLEFAVHGQRQTVKQDLFLKEDKAR